MSWLTNRRREVFAVFGVLLLVAVVRWAEVAVGSKAWLAEDLPVLNLPLRAYLGEQLRGGRLVLWTPLLQGGFPLLAESQAGASYPLRALHALPLAPWVVLAWTVFLHLAWAAAGVYAYLRELGTGRGAALLAGVAYGFSPLLVVRHQHTNVLEALAWWPWLFLTAEVALRRGGVRWLWCGAALGLLAMCGHAQYVVYGGTLLLAYGLCRPVMKPESGLPSCSKEGLRGEVSGAPGSLIGLLVALAVAALLASAQYLPLLELVPQSLRSAGLGIYELSDQVLKPQHLPFFVAPGFWGRIFQPDFGRPALAWEFMAYLGLLPLGLAWCGARSGRPAAKWWAAIAVLALWGALGDRFGLHRLLSLLPGWGGLRGPARLLGVYGLAVAVLAGLGADELGRGRCLVTPRAVRLALGLWAVSCVAMVGLPLLVERIKPGALVSSAWALCWAQLVLLGIVIWLKFAAPSARRWRLAGVILVLVDVLVAGLGLTPSRPGFYDHPPAAKPSRVAVGPGRDPAVMWSQPDTNLLLGQSNIFNMSPLTLRRQVALYDAALADPSGAALARLEQRWGVGWVLGTAAGGSALVQAELSPAPPAWAPRATVAASDPAAAVRETLATDWRVAVLDSPAEPAASPATIRLVRRTPNESVYEAATRGAALFVLNESYYPGRRATVNGVPTPLRRANVVQCAVATEGAGTHRIVVAMASPTIALGRFLTLLALSVLAAGVVLGRRG